MPTGKQDPLNLCRFVQTHRIQYPSLESAQVSHYPPRLDVHYTNGQIIAYDGQKTVIAVQVHLRDRGGQLHLVHEFGVVEVEELS